MDINELATGQTPSLPSTVQEPPAQAVTQPQRPEALKPAGFFLRFFAICIDCLLFTAVAYPFGYLTIALIANSPAAKMKFFSDDLTFTVVFLVMHGWIFQFLLYKPLMEFFYGATIGGRMLSCGLIDANGRKISLLSAFLRNIPLLLFFGPVPVVLLLSQITDSLEIDMLETVPTYYACVGCLFVIDNLVTLLNPNKRSMSDMIAGTYYRKRIW